MGTHNKYLYKEVDKKYTSCNLKTTELLDCVLKGVIIRSNTVALDKEISGKHFVLISPQKRMLWVQLDDALVFYIPFNIKSYRDDGRMIMKGSVK